jgi:hypothetical protein
MKQTNYANIHENVFPFFMLYWEHVEWKKPIFDLKTCDRDIYAF